MREKFQNPNLNAKEMDQDTVLMLVNSHPAVDFPEPLPPNVIMVGGLQIREPKPLPADLDTFISAGKKGAVLVSLGTNIRSDMLDQNRLKMFLEAMSRLPEYNFVWKFESDSLPPQPKNVKTQPWMPQNDILGHSNIKAFVTHSGLLSTTEASWYGVPMVGIPFIADQHRVSWIASK
jgi:glucuronosyltransferase